VTVLVTGSTGHLGAGLIRRLQADGVSAIGMDPLPGPTTAVLGSAADRELVRRTIAEHGVQAIVHAGALHKPQVATHSRAAFIEQNVIATQNLLEEATAAGSTVDRFVFTSTTSLMIDKVLRAGRAGGRTEAAWITEDLAPLRPRNIYGVSKLAAEQLCRLQHELFGLPVVILRTARFFPEEDDQSERIEQSGVNTKANEFLYRRLTLDDVVHCHVLALEHAPRIGLDTLIVSAPSPFAPGDCPELMRNAPGVVARIFPRYRELYARAGWTMFDSIDRVYSAGRAEEVLGFRARTDFTAVLDALQEGRDVGALIGHSPAFRNAPKVAPHV